MKEKVTIEKGTVQETLMLPLYGRYMANKKYPDLFKDVTAKTIIDRIDYDIEQANMGTGPTIVYGLRQDFTARFAKKYLEKYPDAIVVNIGCGLDTVFDFIDNGQCRFVNLDFPEVIEFRERLFDAHERTVNIAGDANDLTWMDKIGYNEGDHVFFMSCGVLFYFQPEDVKKLIDTMGHRFPGSVFVFDYENAKMLARSNKSVRKTGNKGAWMPFSLENAEEEIKAYSETVESVSPVRSLPPEYSVIPGFYRWYFNRTLRTETMTMAEVRFKDRTSL